MVIPPHHVYLCQSETPGYDRVDAAPLVEFAEDTPVTTSLLLLRGLLGQARLDSSRYDTAQWNPLGDLIEPGDKVLLKPNWVQDRNDLPGASLDCVITHPSVIEAVLQYVAKAQPSEIVVGDAPIRSCDFEALGSRCGLDEMVARFERRGYHIQIRDFRLAKREGLSSDKMARNPDPERHCLFDLGQKSWLTPVTQEQTEFRVTTYDPDILRQRHNARTHRYLIAREVMEADVVISLPKLKTHQKTGITGALKNMVGINGLKEYLPHHRKGGSQQGGDCYQEDSRLKRLAEESLDRANKGKRCFSRYFYIHLAGLAMRVEAMIFGNSGNLEGAWYGNDTVWRMCLDLQRILRYGQSNGHLAHTPQRRVITITDAIVAGDGDGPLAPSPVPLRIMTLGTNAAALEWVHCLLMHLDPEKIPLVAHAFAEAPWPLADFSPADIRVHVNGETLPDLKSVAQFGRRFAPPAGWRGHCELEHGSNVVHAT